MTSKGPSPLLKAQWAFTFKISLLILYAFIVLRVRLTFGDAWSKHEYNAHKINSLHYDRLAVDFNLFSIDGVWQEETEAHLRLGTFWKKLGGTWGGDFIRPDGNHYSWGENKMKTMI